MVVPAMFLMTLPCARALMASEDHYVKMLTLAFRAHVKMVEHALLLTVQLYVLVQMVGLEILAKHWMTHVLLTHAKMVEAALLLMMQQNALVRMVGQEILVKK